MEDISIIIEKLRKANLTISVAESCTGGRIASNIVSFEGASILILTFTIRHIAGQFEK